MYARNVIATVLLFIQVDSNVLKFFVFPQRRLQGGLVLQTLLNQCVVFILEAWRARRWVDGQDGFTYTPV